MSSPADPPKSITQLLNSGSEDALDDAFAEVYGELQRLAQHHLQSERPNHTLSATALVNEAYLKVAAQEKSQWSNRAQFFSVASMAMRRILVNHARDNQRKKRGGGAVRISLDQLGHGEGMMSE
ncbi:MAG: ECF-type sigma factor, partial [Pseudomonadota bacterium]